MAANRRAPLVPGRRNRPLAGARRSATGEAVTPGDALAAELGALAAELCDDELRVLLVLARRLLAGQRVYGRLDVRGDGRDWRRERATELADALVYGAIAEVAATLGRDEA